VLDDGNGSADEVRNVDGAMAESLTDLLKGDDEDDDDVVVVDLTPLHSQGFGGLIEQQLEHADERFLYQIVIYNEIKSLQREGQRERGEREYD